MEKIILENLKKNAGLNRYETTIFIDKKNIPILIDATAIEIQKSIDLVNKIIFTNPKSLSIQKRDSKKLLVDIIIQLVYPLKEQSTFGEITNIFVTTKRNKI